MRQYLTLANLLTGGSLAAGFVALQRVSESDLPGAAALVALAALLDSLDGVAARRREDGGNIFGATLDSLADLVSFGVAPAFALYHALPHSPYIVQIASLAVCMVFVLCGALRLARFSVTKDPLYFVGLPIPPAGVLVALGAALAPTPLLVLPTVCLLCALMVSDAPFPTLSSLRRIPRYGAKRCAELTLRNGDDHSPSSAPYAEPAVEDEHEIP